MKSYIQGLITGAVLVFAIIVMMGASNNLFEVERFELFFSDAGYFLSDTMTGDTYIAVKGDWEKTIWLK